jgi:hypothetical protein
LINSSNSYQKQNSTYIKKVLAFFWVLLITPLIAGVYGILHDQITYTISPEYYTKFKFYQFHIAEVGTEAIVPNARTYVSLVGFMATWWTGLVIGLIQGLIGFIHADYKKMLKQVFRSIFLNLLITVITGFLGFVYARIFLSDPNWYFPENLINKSDFIAVGSIHNFGYLGGLLGLITGIIFQF